MAESQNLSGWQPIATAPTDGTWILLVGGRVDEYQYQVENLNPAVIGFWSKHWKGWVYSFWEGAWRGEYENPTHWMPLPSPPSE